MNLKGFNAHWEEHSAVNLKPFLNLLKLILKSQVSIVDPSIRKSDLNDFKFILSIWP